MVYIDVMMGYPSGASETATYCLAIGLSDKHFYSSSEGPVDHNSVPAFHRQQISMIRHGENIRESPSQLQDSASMIHFWRAVSRTHFIFCAFLPSGFPYTYSTQLPRSWPEREERTFVSVPLQILEITRLHCSAAAQLSDTGFRWH